MLLAKQNLDFRGHREDIRFEKANENKGNFLELVRLIGIFNPVLREHLMKVKTVKFTICYHIPKFQNDFVNVLGDQVRKKVIDEMRK